MLICEEFVRETLVAHEALETSMDFRAQWIRVPDDPSNISILDRLVSAACDHQQCTAIYGGRVILAHAIDGSL